MGYMKNFACTVAVIFSVLSAHTQAKCDPENITDARLSQFARELAGSATAMRQASLSSPKDASTVYELGKISSIVRREISASQHDWRLQQRMVHPADRELLRESFGYQVGILKQEIDDSLGSVDTSIGALRSAGIAMLAVRMSDHLRELEKYIHDCRPRD